MAIPPLVKVNIIGLLEKREDIIKNLQDLGSVHISRVRDTEVPYQKISPTQIDTAIQEIFRLIECLSRYQRKGGLIRGMIPAKILIPEDKFNETIKGFDYRDIWDEFQALEKRLHIINEREHHLTVGLTHLRNWQGLDIEFGKLGKTKNTVSMIGTIPFTAYRKLLERCKEIKLVCIEIISESRFENRIFISSHKDVESALTECLKEYNFSEFRDFTLPGKPSSIIEAHLEELSKIPQEREFILERLNELTRYIPQLSILYDDYMNMFNRTDIQRNFLQTKATIIIEGWVKKGTLPYIRRRLEKEGLAVELVKPDKDEIPPVAIENKRLIRPFEIITNLYGLPARWEFDPTPFLMPFFLLFFAICLTDAGYGLVLSITSFLLLKKLKVGVGGKRLLRLLVTLGIATIIVGLLTGGIFGIDFNILSDRWGWLKDVRARIMLFDPMQDPILLLVIALGLGFIQVWFGIFLRMLENFRGGRFLDGILDQGSWLILTLGILFSAILPSHARPITIGMIIIGALSILLFCGRDSKNIFVRFFKGLYSLYGITGILGDVLSYSRLLALALATGVLAMVVNTIALLVLKIPIVGPIAMLGILIGGHTFTIAINALGSFVHCTRLQFVEFFTKFYQGGGEQFKPFAKSYKYTIIEVPTLKPDLGLET